MTVLRDLLRDMGKGLAAGRREPFMWLVLAMFATQMWLMVVAQYPASIGMAVLGFATIEVDKRTRPTGGPTP